MIINWNTIFGNPPNGLPQVFGADIVDWSYYQIGSTGSGPVASTTISVGHTLHNPVVSNMGFGINCPGQNTI